MPNVSDYSTEKEWMGACVPKLVEEGKDQEQAVAACSGMWAEKSIEAPEEVKFGARHTGKEVQAFQTVHDIMVENGALCQKNNGKSEPVEEVIAFGNQIKAVKLEDGSVKFTGYLISFGDQKNTDLTGDFFTKDTDFGDATESDVYFNHRMPVEIDGVAVEYKQKMGRAKLTRDDAGIFAETILKARNAYEKAIIEAGLSGQLGWSSGTAGHLVDREQVEKAWHIKSWMLGLDASTTPTPAEPRNSVIPLKSLITPVSAAVAETDEIKKQSQTIKEFDMDEKEFKALLESNNKALSDTIKTEAKAAAKEAVEEVLEKLPEVKAKMNGNIQVTKDEADEPFKSLGENLTAVAKYARNGTTHPRIKGLQAMEMKAALGSNEAVPSQGEFLLEPTITQTLLQNIHDVGTFSKDAQNLPVGPNSNSGWIPGIDESSRATGSRWGGVRGYHAAEAAAMTASQPKFRKINWELHKIYVLQYASDELLNDVGLLNAIIQKSSMEELDWTFNNDLVNGIGGDRPVGVLQSSSLISIARAATSAVSHADIVAMWARMLPRSKPSAKWYISSDVHAQLDQLTFTSGTTGILSPYIGYGADGVMRIYGKEVVETEFNPALGTLGDILLGDMSQYLTWEKNAVEAASSIHVQFLTDQTAFRFIYRADGQTALNSAITPANGGATQSNFVALLATT